MSRVLNIRLTEAEAAAVSCACIWADGSHKHPNVQSARIKIREALNHPGKYADDDERYVATEC